MDRLAVHIQFFSTSVIPYQKSAKPTDSYHLYFFQSILNVSGVSEPSIVIKTSWKCGHKYEHVSAATILARIFFLLFWQTMKGKEQGEHSTGSFLQLTHVLQNSFLLQADKQVDPNNAFHFVEMCWKKWMLAKSFPFPDF